MVRIVVNRGQPLTPVPRGGIMCPRLRPPAGRKHDGAWLSPSFTNDKGGEIMSDFEILSLVIMMITLVLAALSTKIK